MKLNVEKLKSNQIPIGKNGLVVDNTRVPIKEKVKPIPLNQEQQQNFKLYGSLNKPEVKQTYLSQAKKLTPAEQQASNKKLAEQGKLQAYQKQQEQDAKNLEKAATVAPYVIPGIGQAMWAGKAVDLATSGASDGKYKSWGNMVNQKTGSGEFVGDLTNPGYYAGAFPKLVGKSIQSTSKYALQKAEPYLMGDKTIPAIGGYKPKTGFVDDNFKYLNVADKDILKIGNSSELIKARQIITQTKNEFRKLITTPEFQSRHNALIDLPKNAEIKIPHPSINAVLKQDSYIYTNGFSKLSNPTPDWELPLIKRIASGKSDGIYDSTINSIYVKADRDNLSKLTAHELTHSLMPKTKISKWINDGRNVIKIPDYDWKQYENFTKFSPDEYVWGSIPDEHIAELYSNRIDKQIPYDRNYTKEEAIDFMNNHARLYNYHIIPKKNPQHPEGVKRMNLALDFIQKFGSVAPAAGLYGLTQSKKQGGILKAQEGGGFINKLIKSKEYNSPLATALKIIDPTGVSSYGDVYNAWTDGKFDYNDIIEPLGAVPVFGKLGKVGKFALKGIKGIEDFNNAKKIIKASKFVNSDVIKTGGRTFKTSFNKTFVSPHTFQEYQSAKKFIKGNPLLNYSQYGIKTIAGLDDILDIKNQGKDFLISLQNKSIKKQKGGLLYPKVNQLINRTNQNNIDFVNRLKDPKRKFLTDWENPNQIATHKMSWATDDKGAIIYPNVQNIKGKLIDFTRPPYNKWAGYNSAIQNNDTIQATPEVAQEYTTNYKKFYPQFNK